MNEAIKGVTITVTTTTGRQIVVSERRTRRENWSSMADEAHNVGRRLARQIATQLRERSRA